MKIPNLVAILLMATHTNLHHAELKLQLEVTKPMISLKHAVPNKCGVNWGKTDCFEILLKKFSNIRSECQKTILARCDYAMLK